MSADALAEPTPKPESNETQLPPLSPGEAAFLDAITIPGEQAVVLRDQYDQQIQQEIDALLTEEDKVMVAEVASVLRWKWFGKPGEALPPGVALIERMGGLEIEYISPSTGVHAKSIEGELKKRLTGIVQTRELWLRSYGTVDKFHQAHEALIKERPLYQFLAVMAGETDSGVADRPLTRFQRLVREAEIIRSVVNDLPEGSDLGTHDARSLVQRPLSQLDEELSRQPVQKTDDARRRIEQWILQEANHPERGYPVSGGSLAPEGQQFVAVKFEESGPRMITADGKSINNAYWFEDWAAKLAQQFNTGQRDVCLSNITEVNQLPIRFLRILGWQPRVSPAQALDYAAAELSLAQNQQQRREAADNQHLLVYLRRPQGQVFADYHEYDQKKWSSGYAEAAANIELEAEYEIAKTLVKGRVEGSQRFSKPHLILDKGLRVQSLDLKNTAQYDLLVDYSESLDQSDRFNTPSVPGYTLVGWDRGKWYFQKNEADPYANGEQLIIPEDSQRALMLSYRRMGLNELADVLEQERQLTGTALERLIRQYSTYTFDTTLYNFEDSAVSVVVESGHIDWEGWRSMVKNGKLQLQCTGAQAFFQCSLKNALPHVTTRTLHGRVINPNSSAITAVHHDQTLVVSEGEQYIYDPTPALADSSWTNSEVVAARGIGEILKGGKRLFSRREIIPQPDLQAEAENAQDLTRLRQDMTAQDLIVQSEVQQAQTARQRLEDGVLALFGARDMEQLGPELKRMSKVPDPVYRTLQAARLRDKGEYSDDELRQLQGFIANIRQADDRTLERMRIPLYEDATLALLASVVEDMLKVPQTSPAAPA